MPRGAGMPATKLPKCCAGTARDNCALVEEIQQALLDEAQKIYEEDRQMCRAIGRWGADLLLDNTGVLTHCNAGSLATADYGTALAVIYAAEEAGKQLSVYADETRPLLQGARLTAWELQQQGFDGGTSHAGGKNSSRGNGGRSDCRQRRCRQ